MNRVVPLFFATLLGLSCAYVVQAAEEKTPAERRAACEAEIKKDEALDEPKLTEQYKKDCRAIQVPAAPLRALNDTGSGETAEASTEAATTESSEAAPSTSAATETATSPVTNQEPVRIGGEPALPEYPTQAPQIEASNRPEHQPTSEAQLALNREQLSRVDAEGKSTQPEDTYEGGLGDAAVTTPPADTPETPQAEAPAEQPPATETPEPTAEQPAAEQAPATDPETERAQAQATLAKPATEQLNQGLLANTPQERAVQALQYCREQEYDEQVCASAMRVIQKESRFNPYIKNPTSSAYGFGQYINSTWNSECQRFLEQSASWCAANRSNPQAQLDTLFESTQRRYDRFQAGTLNCRGLGFDACNYAGYHYAGNPNSQYFAAGLAYYNNVINSADRAYQAAFATLAGTNPDVAMAQLSLSQANFQATAGLSLTSSGVSGYAQASFGGGGSTGFSFNQSSLSSFNPFNQQQASYNQPMYNQGFGGQSWGGGGGSFGGGGGTMAATSQPVAQQRPIIIMPTNPTGQPTTPGNPQPNPRVPSGPEPIRGYEAVKKNLSI